MLIIVLLNIYATIVLLNDLGAGVLSKRFFIYILKLWEQTSCANSSGIVREEFIFERKNFMELRILCKHLVADELNGKFTVGEDSADIVGITLPRFYEQHDLSQFLFRITAAGERLNAAVQVLEMDSSDENSVHLLWNVTSDFTAIPQAFTLVLTGVNSDNSITVKFKSCPISVNSDETWEFLPSPELSEQLINQAHNEVQKAINAANRAEKASQTPAPAEIYPATAERLGGIKSGGDVSVSTDGTITVLNSKSIEKEIANIKSFQKSMSNITVQIAHPNNYLIYDDVGKPSVMVAIPKFYLDEVIDGAGHTVHPAFIINGVEQNVIYISKYQNIVENGRSYSLPMQTPKDIINFDDSYNVCKQKGKGWHLMTNAEWAAVALWCKKNGTVPKGNNNYGKDIREPMRYAIPSSYTSDKKIMHTATGSGPASWYHNGTFTGIADLNGNVAERLSGLRLLNSEINIIANNDAADTNNSAGINSSSWKAIMPDGTLAAPGTNGTLKFSGCLPANPLSICDIVSYLVPAPNNAALTLLESLALITHSGAAASDYENAVIYANIEEERTCLRSGWFSSAQNSGIFTMHLETLRTSAVNHNVGFRSAYYEA